MKFCLYIPPFKEYANAKVLADLAKEAETAGWDGFFIWDHIAGENYPEEIVDPWVALTAIAMNTTRIRIGALVTPLPRRRPWKVARETVSIDRLSNGRLIFGVGIGSGKGEFDNLGEEPNPKTRGRMLDEGLDVLTALWSGETVEHMGEFYRVQDARFLPKPTQTPRIPIWVAGIWPNKPPFRRAARWDGIFPLFRNAGDKDLEFVKEAIGYIREHRRDNTPFDFVHRGPPLPPDNPEEVGEIIEAYEAVGVNWWQISLSPGNFGGELKGHWPLDKMHQQLLDGPPKI